MAINSSMMASPFLLMYTLDGWIEGCGYANVKILRLTLIIVLKVLPKI